MHSSSITPSKFLITTTITFHLVILLITTLHLEHHLVSASGTETVELPPFARDCLLAAYKRFRKEATSRGLECSHARVGRCYCTVDYPKRGEKGGNLKANRRAAFQRAMDRMAEATEGFARLAAETFEGDMFITYLCTTAKESALEDEAQRAVAG
ncbi:hypothetical protein TYRP_014744, partial [Tyrophagus putrescentiae]